MRRPFILVLLAFAALSWNAALVAAPAADEPRLSALVYAGGSLICHQRSDRSFHRQGAQLPVCARCFGLYAGALAGVIGWFVFAGAGARPTDRARRLLASGVRRPLIIAALPTMLTVLSATVGWWDPGNVVRALLAAPLGAAIAAVVVAVAARDLR